MNKLLQLAMHIILDSFHTLVENFKKDETIYDIIIKETDENFSVDEDGELFLII